MRNILPLFNYDYSRWCRCLPAHRSAQHHSGIGCRAVREPAPGAFPAELEAQPLPADPAQAMTSSHRRSVRGDPADHAVIAVTSTLPVTVCEPCVTVSLSQCSVHSPGSRSSNQRLVVVQEHETGRMFPDSVLNSARRLTRSLPSAFVVQPLLQCRTVALDPAPDCRGVRLQAASLSSSSTSRNESECRSYPRTAQRISSGSVARHLKIAGRIVFFMIYSASQSPSAELPAHRSLVLSMTSVTTRIGRI